MNISISSYKNIIIIIMIIILIIVTDLKFNPYVRKLKLV